MILTLLAISLNDKPLSQPIMARFDSAGGSIGRADHNTLALPDPERFISRQQAEVVATGDGYLIRNTGVTNRIQVGGRAVPSGETARLQHGDQIRIAGYLLQVECHALDDSREDESSLNARLRAARLMTVSAETSTAPPAPLPPPLLATAITGLSSDNPFADLLGPSASRQVDPFADLLGPLLTSPSAPIPAPGPGPAPQGSPFLSSPLGVDPRSAAFAAPPPPPPANWLPADFDPFGTPARTPPSPPNATPVDPFAGLMPDSAVPSIDDAFGLADSDKRSADPLADFMADLAAPASPGSRGLSTDPLDLFGNDSPAPRPAVAPAQADHLSALKGAYQPPKLVITPPQPGSVQPLDAPVGLAEDMPSDISDATRTVLPLATEPPPRHRQPAAAPEPTAASAPAAVATPAAVAASQDAEAMWAAFCEGAGVQLQLPVGAGPERMRHIGMILRSAVEGTLQLTAVRASTRHELRAEVTVIQQRSNNPLKFSPDAAAGVEALVQPPIRGFLDGPAAMEETMNDLVGHSIGTVAGIRAAIEGMLGRFDPAALEAKLASGSMLDSLLPINRRAKLWDLYLLHHMAIREEAQEDFHKLFGKAFLAAYEQQIQRLKANRAPR